MLQKMRSSTGSWIAKGILGLLVLSFAAWGIADYQGLDRSNTVVAEVGYREIGTRELAVNYRQFLVQQNLTQLDPDVARQLNLAEAVLQDMISRALYEVEASKFHLTASDRMVRQSIERQPDFTSITGQFDRLRFEQYLAFTGQTEAGMVETVRAELGRELLINAVAAGTAAAPAVTDMLLRYFGEQRSAEFLRLPMDFLPPPDLPDDSTLKSFFEERREDFRRPELRSLSYVLIAPEAIAETVNVTDADIQAAYDTRRSEFVQPELRELAQILFTSEADAAEAATALTALPVDQINDKAAELTLEIVELGPMTRAAVPNEGLANAAFALSEPGVTEAFQGTFGWSVVIVRNIQTGIEPTLEDLRDELRADLALDRAYDEVFNQGNTLEDGFNQGLSLEDAADTIGFEVTRIDAVDAGGRGADGTALDDLPAGLVFLRTAFNLEAGGVSFLETTESNAMFMVRVDAVTPAAIPDFKVVRDEVSTAWREDAQLLASEKLAEDLVRRLKTAVDIGLIASAIGAETGMSEKFIRTGQADEGAGLPSSLANTLFDKAIGEAAFAQEGDHYIVARLTEIHAVETSEDDASEDDDMVRSNIEGSFSVGMAQDIVEQLGAALRTRHPAQTFPEAIDQIYQ